MPAVSNTSPILNLAIIGRLTLLRNQFGEVWVPPAVVEEIRIDEELPGCQSVRQAMEEGWLKVAKVEDLSLVQVLRQSLDWARRAPCGWVRRHGHENPYRASYHWCGSAADDFEEETLAPRRQGEQMWIAGRRIERILLNDPYSLLFPVF
jgi:hypothetical protein